MSKNIVIDPMQPLKPPKKKGDVAVADELVTDVVGKLDNVVQFEDSEKSNFATLQNLNGGNTCGNVATSDVFEITDEFRRFAQQFGLNLDDSHEARIDRAAQNMNRSMLCLLAAGIDLLTLRAECEHGLFLAMLEERGLERTAAYRAIQYAQFLISQPEPERKKLLSFPKSHVLALASADPEVVEDLLEDGDIELKALSVRELRHTIKELERKKTDLAVQLETAELERDEKEKTIRALRETRIMTGGDVPLEVQDIRLEMAALHKKSELALQDMGILFERLADGEYQLSEWRESVERHTASSVASLHILTGNILTSIGRDIQIAVGEPGTLDILSKEEVIRLAQEYKSLIEEHRHEKELREWQREQERPRGKGRPKNRPE